MENDLEFVTNKKENVLEKLNKRNKDRQNHFETVLEQRSKETTKTEDVDYFVKIFLERARKIEKNINNIQSDNIDLIQTFSIINNNIQELQKSLSNSTMFLPDYNIKACQNILNDLTNQSDEMKQKLIPKKKFGFNSKKSIQLKSSIKIGANLDDLNEKKSLTSFFKWTLSNRNNDYIILKGDEVDKKDITITNIKNCFIEIYGHPGSIQITKCENFILLSGPVSRSVFAEDCFNFKIAIACQQLRLHSSKDIKIWLHVTCRAIIEDCTNILINNYNYSYNGIDDDYIKSGLDRNINKYNDIADFNWLSTDKPSPNWKLMCSDNFECNIWDMLRDKFIKNKTIV